MPHDIYIYTRAVIGTKAHTLKNYAQQPYLQNSPEDKCVLADSNHADFTMT